MVAHNDIIHSDPEILAGEPVFAGTRVPLRNLYEYLEAGDSLEVFLDAFPDVTKDQAVAALELEREAVTVDDETEGMLLESIAQCDRGGTVPLQTVLEELRRKD